MTSRSGCSISTSANYHWVERISAHTNGNGVLKLNLHGNSGVSATQFNYVEINIFTDDVELTDRLIKAINGAAHKADDVSEAA